MAERALGFNGYNLLTFDTEEWFHANYEQVNPDACRKKGSRFHQQMEDLLQLCSDTGSRATFFVLGCIGEDYPDIIRSIVRAGHEVASHGYNHQLAYTQSRDAFQADVKKSVSILEDLTGVKVSGYRAPSWSIVERNLDYLEALEELDLVYDASIFPVQTFLYGIPDAPTMIHHPRVNGRKLNLYEVPMSVARLFGKNIGYSGGFYFRFFPHFFIQYCIQRANQRGENAIVYLHPREIDAEEQRLNLPLKEAFIHFYNIGNTRRKLVKIMREFSFVSIVEHLQTSR